MGLPDQADWIQAIWRFHFVHFFLLLDKRPRRYYYTGGLLIINSVVLVIEIRPKTVIVRFAPIAIPTESLHLVA